MRKIIDLERFMLDSTNQPYVYTCIYCLEYVSNVMMPMSSILSTLNGFPSHNAFNPNIWIDPTKRNRVSDVC